MVSILIMLKIQQSSAKNSHGMEILSMLIMLEGLPRQPCHSFCCGFHHFHGKSGRGAGKAHAPRILGSDILFRGPERGSTVEYPELRK